eukprot:IDg3365t1
MRISDFSIGNAPARFKKIHHRLRLPTVFQSATATSSHPKVARGGKNMILRMERTIHVVSSTFNINSFSDEECMSHFRFRRCELSQIAALVGWKAGRKKRNRYNCDPLAETCIMLRRLSTPTRYVDMEKDFSTHASALSEIFWRLLCAFKSNRARWSHLYGRTSSSNVHLCMPSASAKRTACFQGAHAHRRVQYYLYADKAYVIRPWMQTAYPNPVTAAQKELNKSMNAVRTSVEWSYGEVKQHFSSQDFGHKLHVCRVPIAVMHVCALLLRNFKTCLRHGGQGPHYFRCIPPALARYTTIPDRGRTGCVDYFLLFFGEPSSSVLSLENLTVPSRMVSPASRSAFFLASSAQRSSFSLANLSSMAAMKSSRYCSRSPTSSETPDADSILQVYMR